jgi:thioredoxin-dependent peroxiredoxin
MRELEPGSRAPAFRLPQAGGDAVSLADFRGRKLVLFFYPRADTAGCTLESKAFSERAKAFARAGTALLGVSADPVKKQEAFQAKHRLALALASDESQAMLKAYGVWGKKTMYGKTFFGIIRSTFLIGPDGRIARIWRKVKVEGHADEVLAAAQAL